MEYIWPVPYDSAMDQRFLPTTTIPERGYGLDQIVGSSKIYVQEGDP